MTPRHQHVTPFVRWPGGKRLLLSHLLPHCPPDVVNYTEPFVGGGAMFFALAHHQQRPRLFNAPRTPRLADLNTDLINAYRVVRDHVEPLLDALEIHERRHHDPTHFYAVRERHNETPDHEPIPDPVDAAARFIYLGATCWRGKYQVNKHGKFNNSRSSTDQLIRRPGNLRAASAALAGTEINRTDFSNTPAPRPAEVIYCDPPYDGTFTAYTAHGFGRRDHCRLRDVATGWVAQGATVVISNADTDYIRALYAADPWVVGSVAEPQALGAAADTPNNAVNALLIVGRA